jgi:hypothetical protein
METHMRRHRPRWNSWLLPLGFVVMTTTAGCSDRSATGYRSAVTGEPCEPDVQTLVPPEGGPTSRGKGQGRGGHGSPTGIPGDNMDDEHSGKVDCLGDGNSGQGDDKKNGCEAAPAPGCDANACCVDEPVDPDADKDGEPTGGGTGDGSGGGTGDGSGGGTGDGSGGGTGDGTGGTGDGSGGGTGDGSSGGTGGTDGGAGTCENPCDDDADCGSEKACSAGCCIANPA